MSLNLHAAVRGVIQAVNADVNAWYLKSTGATTAADGTLSATYESPLQLTIQVQPPTARDQQFINYLQLQGVIRTVFIYRDPKAIVRVDARGGDLLRFRQFENQPIDTWLVTHVAETWDVTGGGWTKLYVTLQTDRGMT